MAELKRILLVEDSPHDVELIREALTENHVANEVDVVHDGEAALNNLRGQGDYAARGPVAPAVVLLDLKLPKVDGLEVLAEVKADPRMHNVPVVMLTSSREERDLVRSYDLGVNAYVVKPVDFHEFVEAIKGVGLFWGVINEPPPGGGAPQR